MHWTVTETRSPEGWKQLRRELRSASEQLGSDVGMELHFYPDGRFEGKISTPDPQLGDRSGRGSR